MEQVKGNLTEIREGSYSIGLFGGKERFIRYDLNAFAEMETYYGSIEAAQDALSKGSMIEVRRALWIGLLWDNVVLDELTGEPQRYTITPYEVGSWLTASNMQDILTKLMSAITGAMPEESGQIVPLPQPTEDDLSHTTEVGELSPNA